MAKKLTKKAVKAMYKENPALVYEPMPAEVKALFPVVTVEVCSEYFGIHYTTKHNAKMVGMQSVSTSCEVNPACVGRFNSGKLDLVCVACFSHKQHKAMPSMKTPLARNYDVLNGGIIHDDYIPVINALYFRIEAFGDLGGFIHAENYTNLIRKNPMVRFGWWTKNPFYMVKSFEKYGKPENVRAILSSDRFNKVAAIFAPWKKYIDTVFTVWTSEKEANKAGYSINCGARACLACLNCYKAVEPGTVRYIHELKK